MKVIIKAMELDDEEYSEFMKGVNDILEKDQTELDLKKELEKQKTINENLERSIEYWKSLYASEKETWVKRHCDAIRRCRELGLSDSKVKELFGISWVGILDYYIEDMKQNKQPYGFKNKGE